MIQEFTLLGQWWIPTSQNTRIIGALKFNPVNGGFLDLRGSFDNDPTRGSSYDIIHGVIWDGMPVTLWLCQETEKKNSGGIITSLMKIQFIFIGGLFNSSSDIKFTSVNIQYSYLDDWLDISGFEKTVFPDEDKALNVLYQNPETIKTSINENYILEIQPKCNLRSSELGKRHVSMQQDFIVKIESNQERSFDEYMHLKNRLRDLLTLAVSESVQTLSFEGQMRIQNDREGVRETRDIKIVIFYRTTNFVYPREKVSPFHVLFRYGDISNRFTNLINKWFSNEQILKPVYDLYFGTMHDPDMYLSQQFLSVMQAIETYHRRRRNNNDLPPDEHEKRINAIIDSAPPEHKDWLNCELKYSNEPALRKRLKELAKKDFATITDLFIEGKRKKDSFISKLVATRNYLTHYGSDLTNMVVENYAMIRLTVRAKLILESCLLQELGFTNEEIKTMIQKTKHFQIAKQ